MPGKLDEDLHVLARDLLAGNYLAAVASSGLADAVQWCQRGDEVVSDQQRRRLAAEAAVRLLALRRQHPTSACRLLLLAATGDAAGQAVNHGLHQLMQMPQLNGQYEATFEGPSRSDASFQLPATPLEPTQADPIVGSCGSGSMSVTFTVGGGSEEVGRGMATALAAVLPMQHRVGKQGRASCDLPRRSPTCRTLSSCGRT